MKQIIMLIGLIVTFCYSLLAYPQAGFAVVDLPWSTSFNSLCDAEWTWSPATYLPPCYPEYNRDRDKSCSGGEGTQITSVANMTAGGGGSGQRQWIGDGTNNNSGGLAVSFTSTQSELWVRWYIRYEAGFAWNPMHYDKILYFNPGEMRAVVPQWRGADVLNIWSGAGGNHESPSGHGWATVMGGATSDGLWHCHEVHLKMDTNGSNGVGQYWIDGVLHVDYSNINFGTQSGWDHMLIGSNQSYPDNGRCMAVDFDDIAISNTGYIGPFSGKGGDTIPPTVSVTSPTQGQIVSENLAISAIASDNVEVVGVQFKLDGADIGAEDTTSPYSISWDTTTVSDGSYTLTATARDAANQTTLSSVDVIISNDGGQDTIPPSVSITAPTGGQTVSGTIVVSATASDNVGVEGVQFKFDGADLGAEDTTSPYSILWNTTTVSDGSYTLTATARDAAGNQTTSNSVNVTVSSGGGGGALLFEESFEDADFASRGWYDNTNLQLSTTEHISGSNSSVEYHFLQGATTPVSGGAIRKKFTDTDDTIHVSYYVKYSSNWEGSNRSYHPHEFLILTNENGDWDGPAYTHLTAYIEQNEGEPFLGIQDGQNIDENNIGMDLTNITEQRSVAGCNGDSDGYGNGECYAAGSVHWNGKKWKAGSVYFSDTPGPYYKNDWHHIEAYIKLNSISGGIGQKDGVLRYWYDGSLIIDHNDVMLRTGQHPNMKFNQFIIAPWIGDGSPVDQTFWIDNLTVATSRALLPPSAPADVHIVQP